MICSGKTGTLAENRMTAAVLQIADESVAISPDDRAVNGERSEFRLLLAGAALCNDAIPQAVGADAKSSTPIGDPTETALVAAANRFGLRQPDLERVFPRVAEVPFSSERKRMTTVHSIPSETGRVPFDIDFGYSRYFAITKGAVDNLLELSRSVWIHGRAESLSQALHDRLQEANDDLARSGMRVLGVAFRVLDSLPEITGAALEHELTFVGMVGIVDPPRREAFSAVDKCKGAGIRTIMITGDHPLTAQYVAGLLGITSGEPVVTGPELERLSASELVRLTESAAVYARVSPEHKLKIVNGLQQNGNIVAMTGDGVNDAPALKKADIGVAMGVTGTDVAREAADMVLLDDNFATIVEAVEEGRVIYDNVRKFIRYILATNSGEIWVMLAAPFLRMPLPLLPLQILWMNLVTDGLPALALGVEPAECDTMRRGPHRPDESIFARGMGRHVVWVGLLMASLSLGTGYWYWQRGDTNWQTMLFTTLTLSQMAHIMAIRSESQSLFQIGLLSNLPLLGAVCSTFVLQFALVYVPFLQAFFKTRPLSLFDLALTIGLSSVVFAAVELEKRITRRSLNPEVGVHAKK